MIRKDYKLTLDEEKNIKYNEMRKIIEGKNNIYQDLKVIVIIVQKEKKN